MQIIPVLDIKGYPNPIAVQAYRGERNKYRPLKSVLCDSSDPLMLATNLEHKYRISTIYVADLDGIQYKTRNWALIKEIQTKTNLSLYLDTGIRTKEDLYHIIDLGINYPIIATETMLDHKEILEGIEGLKQNHKIVISIDLWKGKVQSNDPSIADKPIKSLLSTFDYNQVAGFIVLELTQIGTQGGVQLTPVKTALNHTSKWIITGGGTKNLTELLELKALGIHGVLIGTALHKGTITREMIDQIQNS
ncbi:MAG: HisA/HisF-related TIM barrel protein [Candidatus Heimdallarchaeota archaeon]